MATLSTRLPAPPQSSWPEMPTEWRRYLMVMDSMMRGLNSSLDYSELTTADTDNIATKLSARAQAQRLVMRVMSFADVSLTAPPGGETDGDLYFVNGTGTGAWATYDNQAMLYDSSAYTALGTLEPGQLAWDETTQVMYVAQNDSTIARLAPTAQTMVDDIQADSVALADLNTTVRYDTAWIETTVATNTAGSLTVTRPAGWTSYRYMGSYWDNGVPYMRSAIGTSAVASFTLTLTGSVAFAAANNSFILIRIS
jgi:hypothetical protein